MRLGENEPSGWHGYSSSISHTVRQLAPYSVVELAADLAVPIVIRQQLFSSFLIQRTLGVWVDQQTLYRLSISSGQGQRAATKILVSLRTSGGGRRRPGHHKEGGLTTNTCPTPYFLFQLFLSVSTQISPAFDTFGWKIRVIIVPTKSVRVQTHFSSLIGESSSNEARRTLWRKIRILWPKFESDSEESSFVRCSTYYQK